MDDTPGQGNHGPQGGASGPPNPWDHQHGARPAPADANDPWRRPAPTTTAAPLPQERRAGVSPIWPIIVIPVVALLTAAIVAIVPLALTLADTMDVASRSRQITEGERFAGEPGVRKTVLVRDGDSTDCSMNGTPDPKVEESQGDETLTVDGTDWKPLGDFTATGEGELWITCSQTDQPLRLRNASDSLHGIWGAAKPRIITSMIIAGLLSLLGIGTAVALAIRRSRRRAAPTGGDAPQSGAVWSQGEHTKPESPLHAQAAATPHEGWARYDGRSAGSVVHGGQGTSVEGQRTGSTAMGAPSPESRPEVDPYTPPRRPDHRGPQAAGEAPWVGHDDRERDVRRSDSTPVVGAWDGDLTRPEDAWTQGGQSSPAERPVAEEYPGDSTPTDATAGVGSVLPGETERRDPADHDGDGHHDDHRTSDVEGNPGHRASDSDPWVDPPMHERQQWDEWAPRRTTDEVPRSDDRSSGPADPGHDADAWRRARPVAHEPARPAASSRWGSGWSDETTPDAPVPAAPHRESHGPDHRTQVIQQDTRPMPTSSGGSEADRQGRLDRGSEGGVPEARAEDPLGEERRDLEGR